MEDRKKFLEIFLELLEEKNLTRKAFSKASGIPYPTVIGWTNLNRLPDFFALVKIADFFNCSIDYLTGRQNDMEYLPNSGLSPSEEKLLASYRMLSKENKLVINHLLENLRK